MIIYFIIYYTYFMDALNGVAFEQAYHIKSINTVCLQIFFFNIFLYHAISFILLIVKSQLFLSL
jgi:hypothetical protein